MSSLAIEVRTAIFVSPGENDFDLASTDGANFGVDTSTLTL
jgi:hypothetical protein